MTPKHDQTMYNRHYPYYNNDTSPGTNSTVTLSFLVPNPPQYLSSNQREKPRLAPPPPAVLSQVLNLPSPTPTPTPGVPYSMQAAPRRSSRMNMSHDTQTNSSLLVFPATAASCLLRGCCLHALLLLLLLPPYRVPTLLSVFCPRSRKRVHNKAVFSGKHSPSPRPTPTSQIAPQVGSQPARSLLNTRTPPDE